MASPQLQKLADSPGLRVLQYLVTSVMVPAFIWYGGKVLDRLERVEILLMRADKETALIEQRLERLEQIVPQRNDQINKIHEKLAQHDIEITILKGKR